METPISFIQMNYILKHKGTMYSNFHYYNYLVFFISYFIIVLYDVIKRGVYTCTL